MKILFTSVGRRVELIQAYKKAAKELGVNLEIVGGDITETAPALFFCDKKIRLPQISDKNYIPFLVKFCKKEQVDALIPTIDTDLLVLSKSADMFEHTKVVISKPDKVAICRDKRLTADYFESVGLKSPKPVDDVNKYESGYPAFIKPKDGSSSINAFRANNKNELISLAERVPDYIIQPFISGTEYTIDIFCDFDGKPIYITPRVRLAVRAGEVLKTQISQDEKIIEEMKQLIADYEPVGAITIQMIRDEKTEDDFYIEINPRYGGGAPLSIKAGADSAKAMLKLLKGEHIGYTKNAAENEAIYSRYDQSIKVN